jgi:uncharacterized protein (DUF1810 family)
VVVSHDPYHLQRFIDAQNRAGAYERALAELKDGRKKGHWMWFIFPQLEGLGRSPMARAYAIRSMAEARAYLGHPVLATRLIECGQALVDLSGLSAMQILGEVDAVKLRSSMTLFSRASSDELVFQEVLDKYYKGSADEATERLLRGA